MQREATAKVLVMFGAFLALILIANTTAAELQPTTAYANYERVVVFEIFTRCG